MMPRFPCSTSIILFRSLQEYGNVLVTVIEKGFPTVGSRVELWVWNCTRIYLNGAGFSSNISLSNKILSLNIHSGKLARSVSWNERDEAGTRLIAYESFEWTNNLLNRIKCKGWYGIVSFGMIALYKWDLTYLPENIIDTPVQEPKHPQYTKSTKLSILERFNNNQRNNQFQLPTS